MQHFLTRSLHLVIGFLWLAGTVPSRAVEGIEPFLDKWALTLPGGGAGWLSVTRQAGYYDAELLWVAGSVVPADSVFFTDNTLFVTRLREEQRKDAGGKVARTQRIADLLMARVEGDDLRLTRLSPRSNGEGVEREEFSGKRIPPLPPAPDLSKVRFGEPVELFDGRSLEGWQTFGGGPSGWRAENGMLLNDAPQEPGKHKSYANIRTAREFEDFKLTCGVRVPKGGNSGIYLRGIYEVQVSDAFGKPPESHIMGAIYSRITPSENASKPAGEWQRYEITLVDRHANVVLNGRTVVANQPLLGCTGGALWSDVRKPGPIYLQGDHTSVEYRNLVLRPVLKDARSLSRATQQAFTSHGALPRLQTIQRRRWQSELSQAGRTR